MSILKGKTNVYQIWACQVCLTDRIWGSCVCPDPIRIVYLICDTCRYVRKHIFQAHIFTPSSSLYPPKEELS